MLVYDKIVEKIVCRMEILELHFAGEVLVFFLS